MTSELWLGHHLHVLALGVSTKVGQMSECLPTMLANMRFPPRMNVNVILQVVFKAVFLGTEWTFVPIFHLLLGMI